MSGVTLHIDIDDRRIQDVLTRLIETGQNPAPVMKDIATYGENSTKGRFRTETAPDGSKWKPNHRGGKILKQQMHLLDSITRDSGEDFAEWGSDTSGDRIQVLYMQQSTNLAGLFAQRINPI